MRMCWSPELRLTIKGLMDIAKGYTNWEKLTHDRK